MLALFIGPVMALAAYRLTRLITKDDFPPVLWVRDRLAGGWRPPTTKQQHHQSFPTGQLDKDSLTNIPGLGMFTLSDGEIRFYARKWDWVPFWVGDLISCPWCASAYMSMGVVGSEALWGPVPLSGWSTVAVWLAVWASSALLASREWA